MHRTAAAFLGLLLVWTGTGAGAAPAAPATPAAAAAPAAQPPQASEAAMAFAGEFADDHLSGMLSRIGGQSEAMRMLSQIDGRLLASAFDAQIDAAVARHGDAWARNLALAWSPLLTDAEMASLAEEGPDSPYAKKYLEQREAAAAAMAELSGELFRQVLAEVIRNTVRSLAPDTPAE